MTSSAFPNVPSALMMFSSAHPPFTVAQRQELEHQALIFKYIIAGVTVPQELLLPIQMSFRQLMVLSQPQRNRPSFGYYGNNGKKIDTEPGRCKRTDGKKWRCSRIAHPQSKYCERHMTRRRCRSRKLVEPPSHSSQSVEPPPSQSSSQSQSSSSAAAAAAAAATVAATVSAAGTGTGTGTFPNLPLHTNGGRQGFTVGNGNNHTTTNNNNMSMMEPLPLPNEVEKEEFRLGLNSEADEYNFLQNDMGSEGYQGFDDFTSSDDSWSLTFHLPKHIVSESRRRPTMANNCFQLQPVRDAEMSNFYDARSKELVFDGQLSTPGCLKEEYQFPQPLFSDSQLNMDSSSSSIDYRPIIDFDCNPDVN